MSRTTFKPLDDTSNLVNRSDVKILSINNKFQLFDIGSEADYKFIPRSNNSDKKSQIEFFGIISSKFYNQLLILDSDLPVITAYLLKISYEQRVKKLPNLVEGLIQQNPLSYSNYNVRPFYTYKTKKMLLAMAQGIGDDFEKTGVFETTFLQLGIKVEHNFFVYQVYDFQQLANLLFLHSNLSSHPREHYDINGSKYVSLNLNIHF